MRAIIGFFVMVQGGLGLAGLFFADGPWGVLRHWVELPWPAYGALFVAGAALMVWGESDRKRKESGAAA
ncbi:hypothetical protein LVX13_32760 [Streptomyces albulus]|uniref:hypothetical protein n=1 Tax=Streptomyces noursei TaxID=1971 RepID=UPI001F41B5F8|nr:hypothetical protein [Streptomyces noursei]MCE4947841.1 hypothetical protein [Streptomyces noursei]